MSAHDLAPTPAPPDADPAAEAAAIVRASGTSFGPGMAILSRPRREGMWALYAFARVIDDIADGPAPLADKRALLAAWDREIDSVYAGRARSAIGRALSDTAARHALPPDEFHALIAGMRMDAEGPIVAPGMAELRGYTRRVAGAVGLLSMRIFGAWRGEASESFALALGDALQFTNILRDVEEDARMGRLYLPAETLARAGVPPDPGVAAAHPRLPLAAAEIGDFAARDFARARALVGAHDRRALAPALMMMGVYAGYLALMRARGFRRDRPVRLSRAGKLWRGLACVAAPGTAVHG